MQNLFLKLSQTLAHLTGSEKPGQSLPDLCRRVEKLEKQHKLEVKKIALLSEQVNQLQTAVGELNSISNILLSVQQQLLEEMAFGPATSSVSRKSGSLIMMPLPGTDDDDLPN